MPVTNQVVSIGTAVAEISSPWINSKLVYLQDGDYDSNSEIYVGGSEVTTANGIKLSKANVTVFQVNGDDTLYAICSAASGSVRVVEVK